MKVRLTRARVLAVVAAGLLASPVVASTAGAVATTQKAIATTVTATYVPPGVAGYKLTVTCANIGGQPGSVQTTATFPAAGGTTTFGFPLLAPGEAGAGDLGSKCSAKVALVYPTGNGLDGNPHGTIAYNARVSIVWGGTPVAASPQPMVSSVYEQPTPVAVGANTTLSITVAFPPSLKITKRIVGTEPKPGATYRLALLCANGPLVLVPEGRHVPSPGATVGVNRENVALPAGPIYGDAYIRYLDLKGGDSYYVTGFDYADWNTDSSCVVFEMDAFGGVASYATSTDVAGVTWPGWGLGEFAGWVTDPADPRYGRIIPGCDAFAAEVCSYSPIWASDFSPAGQTVTVTNAYTGSLLVSKVVTGDPRSNIATYEINVNCNNGGPRDTFLLKDRQSKRFDSIPTGASCLVQETRTDGAIVTTFTDNSGDNTTDGRVVITQSKDGCSKLGSSTTSGTYTSCDAIVTVTNDYNAPATTAAPSTAAPATAAPATTAAPAVTAAPATPVAETPEYAG